MIDIIKDEKFGNIVILRTRDENSGSRVVSVYLFAHV